VIAQDLLDALPAGDEAGSVSGQTQRPPDAAIDSIAGIVWHMRYTAIFEAQPDGGYHAFCPALVGCHSEGDTLDESVLNLREAMTVYLESLRAHGEPFPVEDILIKPLDVAVPV
jgi:predicted RNase H-like HicB family nuclease